MSYWTEWNEARRTILRKELGSRCVSCGSTENLEFDHIDPATKSFAIGNRIHSTLEVLLKELSKCQLLCRTCHQVKSDEEKRTGTHGTLHFYVRYKCKCGPCKKAGTAYYREYDTRHKRRTCSICGRRSRRTNLVEGITVCSICVGSQDGQGTRLQNEL